MPSANGFLITKKFTGQLELINQRSEIWIVPKFRNELEVGMKKNGSHRLTYIYLL